MFVCDFKSLQIYPSCLISDPKSLNIFLASSENYFHVPEDLLRFHPCTMVLTSKYFPFIRNLLVSQEGYLRVSGHDESHFRNVGTGLPDEHNDDFNLM